MRKKLTLDEFKEKMDEVTINKEIPFKSLSISKKKKYKKDLKEKSDEFDKITEKWKGK